MSELQSCDNATVGAANLHPNRVQQALTNPANPRDLAYGKVAHKVLDRLRIVRQMKLPVWFILKRKANLHQETGKRKKRNFRTLSEQI